MKNPSFNFQNTGINNHDDAHHALIQEYQVQLQSVIDSKQYVAAESSIVLPFDESQLNQVFETVSPLKHDSLKYIFVVGIGGSNLGTQAIYTAFRGQLDFLTEARPKMIFLDALVSESFEAIKQIQESQTIHPEEIAFFFISKSGGTSETVANMNVLLQMFHDQSSLLQRIVMITDEGSKLWQKAESLQIKKIALPKIVGGRYSVFSAVGLAPLLLAFDTEFLSELLAGARDAITDSLVSNAQQNNTLQSALATFNHATHSKTIVNNFFFNANLEFVGKWYRQLMGESIGKQKNLDGEIVNTGITPLVSIGSTDLHSMSQLYLGGPNDKFTSFIAVSQAHTYRVTDDTITNQLVDHIEGKSLQDIQTAIYEGVKAAYIQNARPFFEVVFDGITSYGIGYYLQHKMVEMMFLAKLMHVNAFDQPNVEDYKTVTKRILSGASM